MAPIKYQIFPTKTLRQPRVYKLFVYFRKRRFDRGMLLCVKEENDHCFSSWVEM